MKSAIIADFSLATEVNLQKYILNKCGTPGFVAPEILNQEKYTEICDMFSLGIIFHILLLKRSPFEGDFNEIL